MRAPVTRPLSGGADAYERTFALHSSPIDLILKLANAVMAAERFERAAEVLEEGLIVHPRQVGLWVQLRKAKAALAAE